MNELIIKSIVILLCIIFFLFRWRYTRHYKKFTWRTKVKFMIILPIACLYLFGVLDFAFLNFNIYLRLIAGGIILLGGFMLFFSAHKHLNENWSPIIEKKFSKSRSLILEGPYRYIRHPIYVGSMILLLGFFLLSANWLFATIPLIILIIFYSIKIPLEEKELERNFGKKYIEYKKRTGGFFPKIR